MHIMANSLDTVAIVGCGVIGAGWATHFLAQGYTVIATDPGDGAEGDAGGGVRAVGRVLHSRHG